MIMSQMPIARAADAVWRPRDIGSDAGPELQSERITVRLKREFAAFLMRRLERRVMADLADLDNRLLEDIGVIAGPARKACQFPRKQQPMLLPTPIW